MKSRRRAVPAISLIALLLACIATSSTAAPAWWRVSEGRSEVWILGTPMVAPRGMVWDERIAEQRLRGANTLLIAPQPRGGLLALGGLLGAAGAAGALRSSEPMEASLPPALRQRVVAIRIGIGKDASHYAGWKPAAAGTFLQADFLKASDLRAGEITAQVRKIARQAGVSESPAGEYDTGPLISGAGQLGPAGQAACLSSEIRTIEGGPQPLRATAQAWARGEIKPTGAINPLDQACLSAFPPMRLLAEQNLSRESAAVVAALKRPGHTVAVFDLTSLTMTGGIIDRLRGLKLAVTGPQP